MKKDKAFGIFLFILILETDFTYSQRTGRQIPFGFTFPNNQQNNPNAAGHALGHALGGAVNNLLGGLLGGQNSNRPQGCNVNNGGCQQGCLVRRGRRQCYCNLGFILNQDQVTCSDIDECNPLRENPCQDICTNTIGSYQCSCSNGALLLQDGRSCGQNVASCNDNNGGCDQVCKQDPNGLIQCDCQRGYVLGSDERSCTDIDECSSGSHDCSADQICINSIGAFQCLASNDEVGSCDINNGGCEHRCRENKRGTVRCACKNGYKIAPDKKSCQKIESGCADGNGGCQHRCRDTRNGVKCACRKGFELQNDGKSCQDQDECALGTHDCPEICINREGSFRCTTQRDQAGCELNNGGCEQRCRETRRGIKCGCRRGFKLQDDKRSCKEKGGTTTTVDECSVDNGGCDQLCVSNNGEATCECNPGFVLINGLCQRAILPPTSSPIQFSTPSSPAPQTKGCGVNTKKSLIRRIVGGKAADPRDWPWMAAILRNTGNTQFCGGTLITDRHVLTAAHCLIQFTKDEIKVRLGEYNFDTPDENNPTDFRVEEIIRHENYNQQTQENDIAILKLGRTSSFSEFIWPVCLPPPNDDFEGLPGFVIGWGTIHFGGPVSNVLQEVMIPVWKQSDCVKAYPENKVTNSMLCAGQKEGGKDSCQGDSGGPFLVQIFPKDQWYIAGVVSWGIECASPNRPGVYTRVNKYLDWIKSNSRF